MIGAQLERHEGSGIIDDPWRIGANGIYRQPLLLSFLLPALQLRRTLVWPSVHEQEKPRAVPLLARKVERCSSVPVTV